MKYSDHTKFPLKRCIIATIVIILCYLMVLILLYSIVFAADISDKSYIISAVFISLLIASIIGYWLYQLIKYMKTRRDEKK